MTNYALRSLGVSDDRCRLVTQWVRTEEIAGSERETGHGLQSKQSVDE